MSSPSSRSSLAILAVIVVALTAGVAWRLLGDGQADEADGSPTAESAVLDPTESPAGQFSAALAQPVSGASVVRDTLWIRVTAAGQAAAVRRTTLLAQTEGVVRSAPVRENRRIERGEMLVQIDTAEVVLELAQARADLLAAETDYRQRILFDDEIEDPILRAERERVARSMSGLEQAEVRLRQVELDFERTKVIAPFSGRVADLTVIEGQHVEIGAALLTVVDLDPIKVEVQVLEAELGGLTEGRRAEVRFAGLPGEVFTGAVATINPLVDPQTRTGRVTVILNNPDGRIKPGMYAEVSLDSEAIPDRVLVPRAAILERGEGRRRTMLFVFEEGPRGGLAKWRYVNTGRENDHWVEILPDGPEQGMVEPGEQVLVDGHHYLAHDTPIRLVADVAAEGGRPGR